MRQALLPIALVTTLLSSCGSDDGPRAVTEETVELSEYGVIRIDHDTGTAQTQLDAVFCGLTRPATAGSIDELFLTETDSCIVSNDAATDSSSGSDLVCSDTLPAQTISAGDNLLLGSAAGSYADLAQQNTDGNITYSTSSLLPRPPNGLTLDIPGDTFPQLSSVPIPDLQDLVITSPADDELLRSDTAIRWNAASDRTNSRILITASDADVSVTCSLADDGRYNFSAATQAELGELFAASSLSIRRQNFDSPTRGDSGLVILTSIK